MDALRGLGLLFGLGLISAGCSGPMRPRTTLPKPNPPTFAPNSATGSAVPPISAVSPISATTRQAKTTPSNAEKTPAASILPAYPTISEPPSLHTPTAMPDRKSTKSDLKPKTSREIKVVPDDGPPPPHPLGTTSALPASQRKELADLPQTAAIPFDGPTPGPQRPSPLDEASVQRIGERLIAASPSGSPSFRFTTIRNPRPQVHRVAQTLIVVSTGLLAEIQDEADLAKILAGQMAEGTVEYLRRGQPSERAKVTPKELQKTTHDLLTQSGFSPPTVKVRDQPAMTAN